MNLWFVCLVALSGLNAQARTQDRLETCFEVAINAEANGFDPVLLVSLTYEESRFHRGAVSQVGAQGPMQVMPKYFCPGGKVRGCNLVAAGMRAFATYRRRYKTERDVLCHYAAGRVCNQRSRAYAYRVRRRARSIREQYAVLEKMLGPLNVF